jgi:hypothetical protein
MSGGSAGGGGSQILYWQVKAKLFDKKKLILKLLLKMLGIRRNLKKKYKRIVEFLKECRKDTIWRKNSKEPCLLDLRNKLKRF